MICGWFRGHIHARRARGSAPCRPKRRGPAWCWRRSSGNAADKSERAIMRQTGHQSLPMVRRYIREGDLFRENATAGLGL